MKFKECTEKFPIWKTIIGNYGMDQTFTINSKNAVDDIENWPDSPLEWNNNDEYDCAYPFVVHVGAGKFECWYFAGIRVNGYLNETEEEDNFYPSTYSEDFGWEPYHPEDNNYNTMYFIPDQKLQEELIGKGRLPHKLFGSKWMNEQVAYIYDSEKYMKGEIFTSYDALKKFIKEEKFK